MKLLFLLFSWVTLFTQINYPIYLDNNGVSLKAARDAVVGQTYYLEGSEYLVVDNELLRNLVNEDADVSKVVTTFVTDMSYLFYKRDQFNQDLSSWDTSSVSTMSKMFMFASAFSSDISKWNVSEVVDFGDMFHGTRNFNSELSSWNLSSAILLNGMFHDSNFNQNINDWNVSKVLNFSGMFDDTPYFNQPLDQWDMSSAENLGGMFAEAVSFNQDISMWNTSSVVYMTNMFRNAKSFSGNLSNWNVSNVDGKPEDFDLNAGRFKEPKWEPSNSLSLGNYILIPVIIGLVLLLFYWRRSKKESSEASVVPRQETVFKDRIAHFISEKQSKYLTKEELDQLLQIDTLSFESQKTKRAQLIKRINEQYPNLIERIRNPEDKRVFIYRVNI
jgi:surface protein